MQTGHDVDDDNSNNQDDDVCEDVDSESAQERRIALYKINQ